MKFSEFLEEAVGASQQKFVDAGWGDIIKELNDAVCNFHKTYDYEIEHDDPIVKDNPGTNAKRKANITISKVVFSSPTNLNKGKVAKLKMTIYPKCKDKLSVHGIGYVVRRIHIIDDLLKELNNKFKKYFTSIRVQKDPQADLVLYRGGKKVIDWSSTTVVYWLEFDKVANDLSKIEA